MKYLLLFLLLVFSLASTFAADIRSLNHIFKQTFWTDVYEERYCGKNIERFISLAMKKNVDLRGAYLVGIEDKSGWMFGMVNALFAREGGRLITPERTLPPYRVPGEKNWYHHVVLYADGYIFDYDFGNEPKMTKALDYFYKMFTKEERRDDSKYINSKVGGYELEFYPAEDYVLRRNQRLTIQDIKEVKKLKDFLPVIFR